MNWTQRRRRSILRRRLRASDDRFDALVAQRAQLDALAELLGDDIAAKEIAAMHTELNRQDDLEEEMNGPMEDELRQLEALDPHHILNVITVVAIVIAVPMRWLTRPMRSAISRCRRRAKKPVPPGNDESTEILLPGGRVQLYSAIIFSWRHFR